MNIILLNNCDFLIHHLMNTFGNFTKVAVVPEDILKVKLDINSELLPEEQSWSRAETNVSVSCAVYLGVHGPCLLYLCF